MKYRFFRVTAVVAVANYNDETCDEHAHLGVRTALDAVEMLNDSDDLLLEISEQELHLAPMPRVIVTDGGQGPLLPAKKRGRK